YLHYSSITTLPYSFFFFYSYGDPRDLHSFPTRRSSDLEKIHGRRHRQRHMLTTRQRQRFGHDLAQDHLKISDQREGDHRGGDVRSEEHTSELQSRGHLVCRLLLEKKKKKKKKKMTQIKT